MPAASCTSDLISQEYTLDPDDNYSLYITAKKYWKTNLEKNASETDALTLICLHSTSFHKETWEPTLSTLFHVASYEPRLKIKEAWCIECPNHGTSAVKNEVSSLSPNSDARESFTCQRYAQAVYRFLTVKCDFDTETLIGVGHSLGGVAMIALQNIQPFIKFQRVIIVEPMISPAGPEFLQPLRDRLIRSSLKRQDTWADCRQAYDNLKRYNGKSWDARVLGVYVKYALRNTAGNKVSLCCTREEEAAMYRDVDGPIKPVQDLNEACARVPFHIILGKVNDFIPREVQLSIVDPSSPRQFASISYIEGVGHLVPQQAPDALANLIASILANGDKDKDKDKDKSEAVVPDRRSRL